jgi:purine-binding chemotaxis protein CheW
VADLEVRDEITQQYIVVRIGSEEYGIGIDYIDNIIRMTNIYRVPTAQYYFRGVINLRGEVVPVMSIRKKMGLDNDENTDKSRIIILKAEENEKIGIIVDAVSEVVNLAQSQIEPAGHEARTLKDTFINGIGKDGDRLISLFDINSIIEDKENL